MGRGGELSDFRAIRCEFRGFHFSLFKSKNGRRILRNLPEWNHFKNLGGGGIWTFDILDNSADSAEFVTFTS